MATSDPLERSALNRLNDPLNRARFTDTFTQAPASFQFQEGTATDAGPRLIGGAVGAALLLDGPPDDLMSVQLSVVVPPDNLRLAARSGQVVMLTMIALAPKWNAGHSWSMDCLKRGGIGKQVQEFSSQHAGWRYWLKTDRGRSLVTLVVTKEQDAT